MRRAVVAVALACLGVWSIAQSDAAFVGPRRALLVQKSWLPTVGGVQPTLFADFSTGTHYWLNGKQYYSSAAFLTAVSATFTRASPAYYYNVSGALTSASSGVLRYGYVSGNAAGIRLEGAGTNLALWCRDWTQSAWVATNATVALNQTGADGAANSASSITATAANATVLQSITQASTQDTHSVFVKRLVGSGEIDITMDGGTTWTNVTASINSISYTRVSQTQTVTNPQFGVRVVASGDAIAVDFDQIEAFGTATSPILTTATTATRAADLLYWPTSGWINTAQGTWLVTSISVTGLASLDQRLLATNNNGTYGAGNGSVLTLTNSDIYQFGGNATSVSFTDGAYATGFKVAAGYQVSNTAQEVQNIPAINQTAPWTLPASTPIACKLEH